MDTQMVVEQTRIALSTVVIAATETSIARALPPASTPTMDMEMPTSLSPASSFAPTGTIDPNQPTSIPPGMPYVLITNVTLDGENYVVDYETMAFIESMTSRHIHFFFNTTKVEDAGVPGKGPYILYGGPRPFSEATIFDRPPEATQICALVANLDHTVISGSGNCFDLPVPVGGTPTPPKIAPTPKPTKDKSGGGGYYP
jgi:hypothetical protein